MEDRVKVIWISFNPPTMRATKGGSGTFNYYFKSFFEDNRFDIRLVSIAHNNELLYDKLDKNAYILKIDSSLLGRIKKIANIESVYNPWNRNANMISNQAVSFIKNSLFNIKRSGFYPDVIILEWTQCVVLARQIKKIFPNSKIVASEHDISFIGYKRKYEREKNYYKKFLLNIRQKHLKKIEIMSLKSCDLVLPHNPENVNVLVNNGIDKKNVHWLVPFFQPLSECDINKKRNNDILFFGAMDRPENYLSAIWFAENVLPLIPDKKVRFIILGSNPSDRLKEILNDRIIVTGFVESITSYFENSLCFVAPLVLGAGIKIKVLEALSSGMAVLTNSIGIEGINAKDGLEYLKCETPYDYALCIRELLESRVDAKALGENARELIKKDFDVQHSNFEYKEIIYAMRR